MKNPLREVDDVLLRAQVENVDRVLAALGEILEG